MEMTIYQRVKCVLENKSISVNALSKKINVAQATLNPQLKGDRTLAANIVEKILTAFPDVSAHHDDSVLKAKYEELEKRYDQLLSILGGGIRKQM